MTNIICAVINKIKTNDIMAIAAEITYKLLFAFFPFLMFLLTILSFFTLDIYALTSYIDGVLPEQLLVFIELISESIINAPRTRILSISLLFAIFSAAMGFKSLLKGVYKLYYDEPDTRSFIKIMLSSLLLVISFTFTLIVALITIIFGSSIIHFLDIIFGWHTGFEFLIQAISTTLAICIMLITAILINILAQKEKVPIKKILPGSIFTVVMWVLSSYLFSFYVQNFWRMASVYGSVAGIMIFMLWLNIICVMTLVGSSVNSVLRAR